MTRLPNSFWRNLPGRYARCMMPLPLQHRHHMVEELVIGFRQARVHNLHTGDVVDQVS